MSGQRTFRWILALHLMWLSLVSLLGYWWTKLVTLQSQRIGELESALRVLTSSSDHLVKTRRMLFWESSTFFLLLLASSVALFWLYFRDAKRNRSLQAFFASITHELRTPLTSIRLQAESLAQSSPENTPRLVQRLLQDTLRMEGQVERSLELARLEGGGPVFTQSVDLGSWARRSLAHQMEALHSTIAIHANWGDSFVVADLASIQVIFKNLIENSIRHSGQSPVQISIESQVKDGFVLIAYSDNGRNKIEDYRKLGKLFQRGIKSSGAGVGLYLVQELMRRMGGYAHFKQSHEPLSGLEIILAFRQAQVDPK